MDDLKPQPCTEDIRKAIALIPGPAVSTRSFQQLAPRPLRSTTPPEIATHMRAMTSLGQMVTVKLPRKRETVIFVKRLPTTIDWDQQQLIPYTEFTDRFSLPINKAISQAVATYLIDNNYIIRHD